MAWRSVAYPLVLIGLPPIFIALLGSNPLPQGLFAILLSGWTGLAIFLAVVKEKAFPFGLLRTAPVVLSVALGVLMLARLGGATTQAYGDTKVEFFWTQNLILLLAGILIGRDRKHFQLFVTLTLLVAVASASVLAEELLSGQAEAVLPGRFALSPEENPIHLGRQSAEGLIVAIYFLLASVGSSYRLYALASVPPLGVALLASGSRGPVVGLLLGLAALIACLMDDPSSRRKVPFILLGTVAVILLVSQIVPGDATSRSLSILTESGSGVASNGRTDLWGQAYDAFADHPFLGLGTGGFANVNPDERYPHNLLLESAAELGVLGLLLVLGSVIPALARLLRVWRRSSFPGRQGAALVVGLLVSEFVNALLSGDITINNALWLAMGLAVGFSARAAPRGSLVER